MNFVRHPIAFDIADGVSARVLDEQPSRERKWPINYDSLEPLAIAADLASIVFISLLSSVSYYLLEPGTPVDIGKSFGAGILVSALFISLMKIRGLYSPTELLALRSQIRATCLSWIGVFLLLAATVFALKIGNEISRGTSILFATFGLIGLILQRAVLRQLLQKGLAGRRFSGRKIVLITDHWQAGDASLSQTLTELGLQVKENFVILAPKLAPRRREKVVAQLIERIRGSEIEEIVVGADPNRWPELRSLVADLRVLPFPVSFIPVGAAAEIFNRPSRDLGKAICIELQRGPLTSIEQAAKRCMDVLFASVGLISLLPLLTIVAIAIKIDSAGPVLFRQQRCGFNGKCFYIRKFRTMSVLEDGPSMIQAQVADRRVTRVGRWLRRTSIDELPQLLDVLEGNMCLVGPRPHALAHDNQFDKMVRKYAFRRRVKPGLTGWAQVNGQRGETPTTDSIERRVEYDLWYIDNWSLWLDIKILLQTPIEIFRGRNAY
jgi:putative colanic acid biosysnthesis UDP-glucose lipid carrier transferase